MTGVAAWGEYPDHVSVVGWAIEPVSQRKNIVVASLFRDTTQTGPFFPLRRLREFEIAAGLQGNELPGALSRQMASIPTTYPFTYFTRVEPIEGGAISVDPRGLITVVGTTSNSTDYPVTPALAGVWVAGRGPQAGHGIQPTEPDAILSVVDMLPNGVCRSDRTGNCIASGIGWPTSGDGGTTPLCALPAFLGGPVPPGPSLNRMMIDFEGSPVAGALIAILVDRPPPSALAVGVWQLGFPSSSPNTVTFPGVELWANTSTPVYLPQAPMASLREPLFPAGLPSGSHTFSIQYICLLSQNLCGDPALLHAGSPALVVSY